MQETDPTKTMNTKPEVASLLKKFTSLAKHAGIVPSETCSFEESAGEGYAWCDVVEKIEPDFEETVIVMGRLDEDDEDYKVESATVFRCHELPKDKVESSQVRYFSFDVRDDDCEVPGEYSYDIFHVYARIFGLSDEELEATQCYSFESSYNNDDNDVPYGENTDYWVNVFEFAGYTVEVLIWFAQGNTPGIRVLNANGDVVSQVNDWGVAHDGDSGMRAYNPMEGVLFLLSMGDDNTTTIADLRTVKK